MFRMQAVEFLKFHLGTLFLSNYEMPSFEQVTEIIQSGVKVFHDYKPFVSVGCILAYLICKILSHERHLLARAKQEKRHLQSFEERLPLFGDAISPKDKVESPKQFFEKFYDTQYTPQNEDEVARITEWIICVTGFDEANEERTEEALELLKRLEKHLNENMQALISSELEKSDSTDENMEEPDEEPDPTKEQTDKLLLIVKVRDPDTKPCTCYQYECTGDCYHDTSVV